MDHRGLHEGSGFALLVVFAAAHSHCSSSAGTNYADSEAQMDSLDEVATMSPLHASDSGILVTINPNVVALPPNGTQAFRCTVTGSPNIACTWQVAEAGGGNVTAVGAYTAPSTGGTYHVVATSAADPSESDTATVSVLVPCSGVSGAVGRWQFVSPPAFTTPPNMEALSVVVNQQNGTVYAAAGNITNDLACPAGQTCPAGGTGVFESTDCGSNWIQVSDTTPGTDSANLLTGEAWTMLIDPNDPQTLFISNGYGNGPTIYRSTDGGVDWTSLNPDPAHIVGTPLPWVQAIAMDPYDHLHIAVTFHENCASPFNPWCLSQSSDGGNTWQEFDGPTSVPGFAVTGYAEPASISILGPMHYLVVSAQGVYYTADGGSAWTLVLAENDLTSYAGGTWIGSDNILYIGSSTGDVFYSPPTPGQTPPFAIYQAPSLPVPQPRLPFGMGLAPALMPLANSPQVTQLIDDGVSLYASWAGSYATQPVWTAQLTDTTAWTQMPDHICTNNVCRGASQVAYDPVHHIVYSANWGAGLWRLVTR